MLGIGNILITPDHYIIRVCDRDDIFKIHRHIPNALQIFKDMILKLIDESDKSMNEVKDWSQTIPDAKMRKELEELDRKIKEKEFHD
jgi:hypothetical protein